MFGIFFEETLWKKKMFGIVSKALFCRQAKTSKSTFRMIFIIVFDRLRKSKQNTTTNKQTTTTVAQ